MTVLVTGGAGYIGSHVIELLRPRGVVVVDDLSTGHASRVEGVQIVRLDLAAADSSSALAKVMTRHGVDSVIHLAARKKVGESVERPLWYYRQNVDGLLTVLEAMEVAGVRKLVFSSSAAVYGSTAGARIGEDADTKPINPYGETKLVGEQILAATARARGLRAVSLRYFNVAGASRPELADREASNLIPMVFERMDAGMRPRVFGGDYPTRDGSCVRDYVHVADLAEAHRDTLDSLSASTEPHRVFNVGTGVGTTVIEMIAAISRASGSDLDAEIVERRIGDPAEVVASVERIGEQIGWHARFGVDDMVRSAWDAHVAAAVAS